MTAYGFSRVPDKGFFSLEAALEQGEWKEVKLPFLPPPVVEAAASPLDLTGPQLWKWTLLASLQSLLVAFGFGPDRANADRAWDDAQRKLHFTVALALLSADAALVAAAQRVQAHLLLGDGLAQINLAYQAEVDFGFKQVALGRSDALRDDLKRLNASPLLDEVESTTFALAKAIGHTTGQGAGPSPTQWQAQQRAMVACQRTCNTVLTHIDLLLKQPLRVEDHKRLTALRQPLTDLLDRYPRSAADTSDSSSDA